MTVVIGKCLLANIDLRYLAFNFNKVVHFSNFRRIYVSLDTQIDKWGQWMKVKKMTMMIRPMAS